MRTAALISTILSIILSASHSVADDKTSLNIDLHREIASADAKFFDAFNMQDLEAVKNSFTSDLEFYHDKGGVFDYQGNLEATKKLFANNKTLRRELVKGTLAVYPVKDYGAIATGEHKFCHLENGNRACGQFKFLTIWRKENGIWKMAKVISYGH
jgi:ketosteroid isomerase-like protein